MSSAYDDVVIADGMLEQIRFQVHVKRNLRAAEMLTVRSLDSFGLSNEITVQLRTTPFK